MHDVNQVEDLLLPGNGLQAIKLMVSDVWVKYTIPEKSIKLIGIMKAIVA